VDSFLDFSAGAAKVNLPREKPAMYLSFIISALIAILPADSLQRGMSFTAWWHDTYSSPESDSALALLRPDNVEWISLLTTWYQDSARATRIYEDTLRTPSDLSVGHAIARAQALGLKVMLKPHVDCQNGDWRGNIVPDPAGEWFRSYRRFILHYAQIAESLGCEQLCVGTELDNTTNGHESEWRAIIDSVRARFTGPITYAANWDSYRSKVPFWSAVDEVGIDAYFPLTGTNNPTVPQLVSAWNNSWLPDIEALQSQVQKPILLTEIGYRSVDSANIRPWDYGMQGPVDTAEQRDCYDAAFQVFWSKPWFRGFFWWNWEPSPNQGGPDNNGYTPFGKPAERLLRQWYQPVSSLSECRRGFPIPDQRIFPTVVREGSQLTIESRGSTGAGCQLLDAAGHLVQDLHSGTNQVSPGLPAGVYYVESRSSECHPASRLVVVR
jgi:hypothetical protein